MEAIESEPKRVITSARLGRFPTCVPTSAGCSACSQTDRQTDRSADQAQHVEVVVVVVVRVPGGVGVDGDDVVRQRFHCRAAGAAGQTEGKIMTVQTKSGKLKSCLVNWCALRFNRLI